MDSQREDLIAHFSSITGANPSIAQSALQASNWNLEEAVSLFYASNDAGGESLEDEMEDPPPVPTSIPPAAQPSSSSSVRRTQGGRRKQMTLDELKKQQEQEEDDDGDRGQNMFAGGEKSGLAVQNPGQEGPTDHFRNIMNQARQNRERPTAAGEAEDGEAGPPRRNNFAGRAQTLGGDEVGSRVIEDPVGGGARGMHPPERVTRTLHLWADGISIDEGPLHRFDDPANQSMMAEINRGRAPLALLNVQPDQEVDLNLVPHKDENYTPPKQTYKPFSGQGQRLGSPTPGLNTRAPASSLSTNQSATGSAAVVQLDESAPIIQLQIRLADGSRLQSRFNTTHSIGDVYTFVNNADSASSQRQYTLMTTFPSKELGDRTVVLGDLSEFKRGGVVVQRYL